jgi:hypothetical protein
MFVDYLQLEGCKIQRHSFIYTVTVGVSDNHLANYSKSKYASCQQSEHKWCRGRSCWQNASLNKLIGVGKDGSTEQLKWRCPFKPLQRHVYSSFSFTSVHWRISFTSLSRQKSQGTWQNAMQASAWVWRQHARLRLQLWDCQITARVVCGCTEPFAGPNKKKRKLEKAQIV